MGCCETKDSFSLQNFDKKIQTCIHTGNVSLLKQYYQICSKRDTNFDLNAIKLKVDEELIVSPLGLSLLLGQSQIFSMIIEELGGDFLEMERSFEEANTTGLSIICLNNHTNMLPIYLPHFISFTKNDLKPQKNPKKTLTLDQEQSAFTSHPSFLTPIQLACEAGFISILNYFLNFNQSLPLIPHQIDIDYIDPTTGNNCALLSCKTNNFNMIKFLHIQCKADFFVVNSFNENALNVLAIGSKFCSMETFRCVQYLVEKIGIDPCYNYQETLFMLEDQRSVEYFEKILGERGIQTNRTQVVSEGTLQFAKRTLCHNYDTGNRFTFTRLFPELMSSVASNSSFVTTRNPYAPESASQ